MDIYKWMNRRIKKESSPTQVELSPYIISSRSLINATIELSKAFVKNSIQKLKDEWHSDDLSDLVDEHHHHFNSSVPDEFKKVLQDPKEYKFTEGPGLATRLGIKDRGISPKLVSETPHGIFMIKPYHSEDKVSGTMPSDVPFSGFNIMAAKNIYNKAGLDHLIENVSSLPANSNTDIDFPVTVHKFHSKDEYGLGSDLGQKGFTAEGDYSTNPAGGSWAIPITESSLDSRDNPFKINPLQARQMASMDYLLGNVDRHNNNWLVSKVPDTKTGYRNIVAFDHDRLFNYGGDGSRSFADFLQIKGPSRHLKDAHYGDYHGSDDHFKNWWNENKGNISNEMNRQLSYIKDDGTRRYIRSNFASRFEALDKWASTEPEMPITEADHEHEFTPYSSISQDEMHRVLQRLPSDPHEALYAVLDSFPSEFKTPTRADVQGGLNPWKKEHQNRNRRTGLIEIASAVVQNADPQHAGSLVSKMFGDREKDKMRNAILDDLMSNPEAHRDHLSNILENAKQNPNLMSPYRVKKIEDLLRGK